MLNFFSWFKLPPKVLNKKGKGMLPWACSSSYLNFKQQGTVLLALQSRSFLKQKRIELTRKWKPGLFSVLGWISLFLLQQGELEYSLFASFDYRELTHAKECSLSNSPVSLRELPSKSQQGGWGLLKLWYFVMKQPGLDSPGVESLAVSCPGDLSLTEQSFNKIVGGARSVNTCISGGVEARKIVLASALVGLLKLLPDS